MTFTNHLSNATVYLKRLQLSFGKDGPDVRHLVQLKVEGFQLT